MNEAQKQVLSAIKKGNFFGSWLVCGAKGIGKKTFVRQLCSFLTQGDWNIPLNMGNPDIKWLEKNFTEEEKKDIQKTILAGKEVDLTDRKKKGEITVDDVREAISFLSLKSTGSYRILIVNLAEDMNPNAANALLKVLEEPKQDTLILLLTENVEKLLPTIKSRCRRLTIHAMSDSEIGEIVLKQYPKVDISKIVQLSNGSIGKALILAEKDGVALYDEFISLCVPQPQLSIEEIGNFADKICEDEDLFDLFKEFVLDFLKKLVLKNKDKTEEISDAYFKMIHLFSQLDSLKLDKSQLIEQVFFKLSEVVI